MRRIAIALVLALSATAAAQLVSLEVASAATITNITANFSSPVTYGTDVTLTGGTVFGDGVSGFAPLGSVTIKVDGGSGQARTLTDSGDTNTSTFTSVDLGVLGVGTHAITADFNSSDANYDSFAAFPIGSVVVNSATTTITATPSDATPTLGTGINISGNVTGGGTPFGGTVSFTEGGNPVSGLGAANVNNAGHYSSATFSSLGIGGHTIRATYNPPDSNHQSSFVDTVITVAAPASAIAFTSAATVNYGQNYTLTGTVTGSGGTPTGSVVLSGAVTGTFALNGSGAFSVPLTLAQLAVGGHTITANYAGDNNFAAAPAKNFTLTVNKATVTLLAPTSTPAYPGLKTTLPVSVTPTVAPTLAGAVLPTGTVNATGTDGPKTIAGDGTATLNANAVAANTNLTISYSGNANYAAKTTPSALVFTKYAVDVQIKDSSGCGSPGPACASVPPGFPMPLSVVLTPSAGQPTPAAGMAPTGSVVFHDTLNTAFFTPQTATLSGSGVASTFGQFPSPGSDNVFATYAGNANFAASSNTTSPLQVGVPNTDHNTRYVYWVYNDLLGRSPDAAGASYWAGLLNSGTPRAAVAWALVNSTEYRNGVISGMYADFLNRATDTAGLNYWVGQVARGMTFEAFECNLIGSDEYFVNGAKGGGSPTKFVNSMYEDILGRAPDAGGLNYFVSLINGGTSRALVVSAIVYSTENLASTVDGYYEHFLSRGVDASGQSYWVNQLQHGSRDELIVALIIGSDEYFSLV